MKASDSRKKRLVIDQEDLRLYVKKAPKWSSKTIHVIKRKDLRRKKGNFSLHFVQDGQKYVRKSLRCSRKFLGSAEMVQKRLEKSIYLLNDLKNFRNRILIFPVSKLSPLIMFSTKRMISRNVCSLNTAEYQQPSIQSSSWCLALSHRTERRCLQFGLNGVTGALRVNICRLQRSFGDESFSMGWVKKIT